MKLNPDCIRDILLCVETHTDLDNMLSISPNEMPSELSHYSVDEVMYHLKQTELSGFIAVHSWYCDGECEIHYLLPEGHQFLANIRSETVWSNVKEVSKKVGSNSLQAIVQIATGVITQIIQSQLGFI